MNKFKKFLTTDPVPKALIVLALLAISTLGYLNIRTAYQTGGCVTADGYLWCESKQKCVQPWGERCESIAGGDMDEYGCVNSAGYIWCAAKDKCFRPWEESCIGVSVPAKDPHGCVTADGYIWCSSKLKCIKPWIEGCTSIAGGDMDSHGCVGSAGYIWCVSKQKCIRPWKDSCQKITNEEKDAHGCITSAGQAWCESQQKCIQPWMEVCVDIYEGDYDEHGCRTGLGFEWCEISQKCVEPWKEPCEQPKKKRIDEHGCVLSDGFEWCEPEAKCLQPWMEECEATYDAPTNPFPDTDLDTLEGEAAAMLYSRGVISGFPDGEFKGNQPVNRAEAAKFLLLAAGSEIRNLNNDGLFSDVIDGEWYVPYVMTAANEGIISGYPDGSFKPADTVNTAEFLKMLTLAFDLEEGISYTYSDVPDDAWFAKYAGLAEFYDLFPERGSGLLYPDQDMTRKEVAIAIYQYL
jgi:hypothetical protein